MKLGTGSRCQAMSGSLSNLPVVPFRQVRLDCTHGGTIMTPMTFSKIGDNRPIFKANTTKPGITKGDSLIFSRVWFARQIHWLGLVSILGTAYWILSVVLLHFLPTDHDPLKHQISNYATGSYGYLMSAAFIIWGIGIVSLAAGIFLAVTPRPRVGSVLILVAGIAIVIAGVFKGDLITKDTPFSTTTSGAIHDLSSLVAFLFIIVAMFVMARRFKRDEMWRQVQRPSFWLGVASALSLVVFVFGPVPESVDGLGQRIFVFWLLSWVMLAGIRLWFLGRTHDSLSGEPGTGLP